MTARYKLWVGVLLALVLAQVAASVLMPFGNALTIANDLIQGAVTDIQHVGSGSGRRILVGFSGGSGKAGALGVYSGN